MAKRTEVQSYQNDVIRLTRISRPSGWKPSGSQIRISYKFFLKRRVDCDNAMKALNDALAMAIEVNDDLFLPCVQSKSINGKEKYPRVEIEIEDLGESPLLSPASSESSGSLPQSTASSIDSLIEASSFFGALERENRASRKRSSRGSPKT